MVRRIMLSLLAASVVAGSVFATGAPEQSSASAQYGFRAIGYPIVDKPVTLRVATAKNPSHTKAFADMAILKKAEQVTNVKIEWIAIPGDAYNEKLNLMLASGDLPDTINSGMSDFNVVSMGESGVFLPMQDLIEKYAPNLKAIFAKRPAARSWVTASDGNIYALMRMNEGSWTRLGPVFYMTKPWMAKLGIAAPPKTLDEYTQMLLKVKAAGDVNGNGKADDIPLGFRYDQESQGLANFFFAHGLPIQEPGHLYVEGGKVRFAPTTQAYKDTIKYLNKLWAAGLMDREGFNMTGPQYTAKIKQDQYFSFAEWQVENQVDQTRWNNYSVIAPMTVPGHTPQAHYRFAWFRGYNPIIKGNRYPEVTMRWTDYWYDTMNSIEMMEGPIGIRLEKKADGTIGVLPPPKGVGLSEWRDMENLGSGVNVVILAETYRDVFIFEQAERKGTDLKNNYVRFWSKEYWPNPMKSSAEIKEENAMLPDINALISKTKAKWITEGGIDQEWDGFQAQLQKMGLPRLMQIYQKNYDFFLKNVGGTPSLPY